MSLANCHWHHFHKPHKASSSSVIDSKIKIEIIRNSDLSLCLFKKWSQILLFKKERKKDADISKNQTQLLQWILIIKIGANQYKR